MLEILKGLHFKRDPRLVVFAIVLVGAVAGLIAHGDLTTKEGLLFLGSALALPGLFGSKPADESPPPKGPGIKETILPPDELMRLALRPIAVACLAACLAGCAWLQKHGDTLAEIATEKVQCALSNMNLPNEVLIKRCFLKPEDIPKILPLLGTAREEAAREAAGARADERAKLGAGPCDAGLP